MFDQHYTSPLDLSTPVAVLSGGKCHPTPPAGYRWLLDERGERVKRPAIKGENYLSESGKANLAGADHYPHEPSYILVPEPVPAETPTPPDASKWVPIAPVDPDLSPEAFADVALKISHKMYIYEHRIREIAFAVRDRDAKRDAGVRADERERCAVQLQRMGMASAAAELRTRTLA